MTLLPTVEKKKKRKNQLSVIDRRGKRGGLFPVLRPLRELIFTSRNPVLISLMGIFIIILNK